MADTIVLYAAPDHLDHFLFFAKFIADHHPSVPLVVLCSAADSAAASVAKIPSITYRRLPAVAPPPNSIANPVEYSFEVHRLSNPNLRESLLEISQSSTIKAFVIDFFCNAAFEVSTSMNLRTYFFSSSGGFGLCIFLYIPTIHDTTDGNIADLNDYIEIPGCPLIYCSDFPRSMIFRHSNVYKHFLSTSVNMRRSAGCIVNSFDALEYRAKQAISNGSCVPEAPTPPSYFVGPLISENAGGDRHECLRWLDSQPSKSVLFLCFGRKGVFSAEQLKEMAMGLENSGHRFLWSVRNPPGKGGAPAAEEPDLETLLPARFLGRTKHRGFVIKSWAPQRAVLGHDSVGGFVTHCGMASILEAASLGVPMIGWPLYAEQRMNRVFAVEEMKLALPLEETAEGFVTAAELEKRIRELMESTAGRAVRHRAADVKNAAAAALGRNGSSRTDLDGFIQSVQSH